VYRSPNVRGLAIERHSGVVALAWTVVFTLCGIGALYFFVLYQWYAKRPTSGGEAPVLPALSLTLDYLFAAWLLLPALGCIALIFTAIVTWRALFEFRTMPLRRVRRGMLASGALIASVAALAIIVLKMPSMLAAATRSALCRTITFQRSLSPNGRYQASVIEIDCGAMSNFNRQVILTRIPFNWASQSILFFNQQPTLRLSWSDRMLTIRGKQPPLSLAHPPPDPMVWGGIMARYISAEDGPSSQ
jgi:hypothetical protein